MDKKSYHCQRMVQSNKIYRNNQSMNLSPCLCSTGMQRQMYNGISMQNSKLITVEFSTTFCTLNSNQSSMKEIGD
uniref:Uncharacterized protein n=1 Tax=Rhizophora mucronata TaxID=61149 RepID=A0A2P2NJ71_RHIMU